MLENNDEIEKRHKQAILAISNELETKADASAVSDFITHHLEEIDGDFWQKHLGSARPNSIQVLDLLVLRSHWSVVGNDIDDNGIDNFDFTLPENATDYVICVRFDKAGQVDTISMES